MGIWKAEGIYCTRGTGGGGIFFSDECQSIYFPLQGYIQRVDLKSERADSLVVGKVFNVKHMDLHLGLQYAVCSEKRKDHQNIFVLFDLRSQVTTGEFRASGPVKQIKIAPDGKRFGVAAGAEVHLYDVQTEGSFTTAVRVQTFRLQEDAVTTLEWSADGSKLMTGCWDAKARIVEMLSARNASAGKVWTLARGHTSPLVGAFFVQGDKAKEGGEMMVLTVDRNKEFFLWGSSHLKGRGEGEKDPKLNWHIRAKAPEKLAGTLISCTYQRERKMLGLGSRTGVLRLYYINEPTAGSWEFVQVAHISFSANKLSSLGLHASQPWVAINGPAGPLVYDWNANSTVYKQTAHEMESVNCLSFSREGYHLVTGDQTGRVKVWVVFTGACIMSLKEHTAAVVSVRFGLRNTVLSAGEDGVVQSFEFPSKRKARVFAAPDFTPLTCMDISPSGQLIAAGTRETYEILIWDARTGQLNEQLPGHRGPVTAVKFDPTGKSFGSSSWDKTVRVWEFKDKHDVGVAGGASSASSISAVAHAESVDFISEVVDLDFTTEGSHFLAALVDGSIHCTDLEGAVSTEMGPTHPSHFGSVRLAVAPDGKHLVASSDGMLYLFDISEKILLQRWIKDSGDLKHARKKGISFPVAFSPTGQEWAVAMSVGVVKFTSAKRLGFSVTESRPEDFLATSAQVDPLHADLHCQQLSNEQLISLGESLAVMKENPQQEVMALWSLSITRALSSREIPPGHLGARMKAAVRGMQRWQKQFGANVGEIANENAAMLDFLGD